MRVFFATCPAGMEKPASLLAAREVRGFALKNARSGAITFTAKSEMPMCGAFQNLYLQIARLEKCGNLSRAAAQFARDAHALGEAARAMRDYGFLSFRAMFSEANRLSPVEPAVRAAFERAIRFARVDRAKPDTELLVLARSEGFSLLLLRLSKPDPAERALEKGELTPAFARAMVNLCEPEPDGAFLDPFAGSGALGKARRALGNAKVIALSDNDPARAEKLKRLAYARAFSYDALALNRHFPRGAFTEIATDPPWGLYAPLNMPEDVFCEQMLAQFAYLLKPYGRLAVLTASKQAFSKALDNAPFRLRERFDVLVNGKKASVFSLMRAPEPEN